MGMDQTRNYRKALAELFSGYRAEWLDEKIFDLFTEPSYFPQLTTPHPCFLEGGRGTGKTTVLRGLSYRGQAALRADTSRRWPYIGMYYRVNTNRVRAFDGPELNQSRWCRMFAHYINVEFCEAVAGFLAWYSEQNPGTSGLSTSALRRVAETLNISASRTLEDFREELGLAKLRFEVAINNIAASGDSPILSLQGAPVDALLHEVKKLPEFCDSSFFFLIDEYENFNVSQQRVINTLIKHCGALYSFKVGVRELGFKERSTLNENEQLVHPADYKLINIAQELEGRFPKFAAEVCRLRLQEVVGDESAKGINVLLPELSPEEEAIKLGVKDVVAPVMGDLRSGDTDAKNWLANAEMLEVFVLFSRANAEGKTCAEKLREILGDPERWRRHYENYKYGCLFAIRRGKRGIRKYFTGWRIFCLLAASNIRYLLELVDQALSRHFDEDGDPSKPVTHEIQTDVAQGTGQRNLRELEGLSLNGAKLTHLLLALGRIFQVMAEDPSGHTPEVNQFYLDGDIEDEDRRKKVDELVKDGVMNLALLRYPGSKLQQQTDTRQFDYAVHPIFAAFFGFSHRRKRKIPLSDREILSLIERPKGAIKDIVTRQNRIVDAEHEYGELPEQMKLFEGFYATE